MQFSLLLLIMVFVLYSETVLAKKNTAFKLCFDRNYVVTKTCIQMFSTCDFLLKKIKWNSLENIV